MAGDCCHPMPPYLAQGANSSLEDGAVLREKKDEQLIKVAKLYQELRKERGEMIQKRSSKGRTSIYQMARGRKRGTN